MWPLDLSHVLVWVFILVQILYLLSFTLEIYYVTLPINLIKVKDNADLPVSEYPYIVQFYPVLQELESTMRTTMVSLARLDYPSDRFRVVSIPNANDKETIASLKRLTKEFPFLQILEVPPTTDPTWDIVWSSWDRNTKAYWWHKGPRAKNRDLPPKKTRQLIYSFYNIAEELKHEPNLLINYIDADSAPPPDHFKGAICGFEKYDVIQAQNVAGNLNTTMAATWHSFDHMCWDGLKYPHISANGRQPFWVLGKGLFVRAKDLIDLGGLHPWITIEDPEVGLRFWKNGKKLGILSNSLIEEVPETWIEGVNQRKRWVCGFFQTLGEPLREMEFSPIERFKAWLLFLPCLSLVVNAIGLPTGIWALIAFLNGSSHIPHWTIILTAINLQAFVIFMTVLYVKTWKRTALVFDRWQPRALYLLRANPISLLFWWLLWLIPLVIGFRMFIRNEGLVWQRTEKTNANSQLVRTRIVEQATVGE